MQNFTVFVNENIWLKVRMVGDSLLTRQYAGFEFAITKWGKIGICMIVDIRKNIWQ